MADGAPGLGSGERDIEERDAEFAEAGFDAGSEDGAGSSGYTR